MPIVLVELPDNDAAGANVPALISACSAGLHEGRCAVEEPSAERAAAVAIVVWLDEEHLRARIEVGRRAEARAGWQTRELTFHAQDALGERFRSVGLAIAGIVGEATLLEPPRVESKPTTPAAVTTRSSPRATPWRFAFGPALETGVTARRPALGAFFDFGFRPAAHSPVELGLTAAESFSVAESSGIATHFTRLAAGAAVLFSPSADWELRGGAFLGIHGLSAGATGATGVHASSTRWLLGGSLRAQAAWPARSRVSGVLGIEITELSGATTLRNGARDELGPAASAGAQLGLECRF